MVSNIKEKESSKVKEDVFQKEENQKNNEEGRGAKEI
jgi:hypothetical protein